MSSASTVRIEGLSYSHRQGKHERRVLSDISIAFAPAAITMLTGASGSGKSTLLTIIGALRSASSGSVEVLGTQLIGARERQRVAVRRRIGFIFQKHNLAPALTVRENIHMGLQLGERCSRHEARQRIETIAAALGLGDQLDKHPARLSGGQQQRAGIARALVNRPQLILADEPTASLDRDSGAAVMQELHSVAREEGATILLVTHDKRVLDEADALITLEDGRLAKPADGLLEETSANVRSLRRLGSGDLGRLLGFGNALAQVAMADHVLTAEETAIIRQRIQDSGVLSPAELDFVMEIVLAMGDSWNALHGSAERREELRRALEEVALADEHISDEERAVIDSLMVGPGNPR